jgi:phosphoribosylaminoimidazole carboxylase/phosphoribosylaminoimidazole-succinocarboxamide synthase
MGSLSDEEYCIKIAKHCKELGLICQLRVTSAHKGTEGTLQILAEYEGTGNLFDIMHFCKGKLVPIV